jgi:Ca2+-binding EF-hand superfamily protein
MSADSTIDWDSIREKLPTEKTPELKAKRSELFDQFDPNGNGFLSLAEVDKGCRDVLGLYELFECKKVIMRAFQAAKGVNNNAKSSKSKSESLGNDFIEKCEFRLLLVYLRQYFEAWQMFEGVDSGNDRRINLEEFKAAIPKIEPWGFKVEDPEAEFAIIDANGGGQLLFDEFADWAIKKGLDLEDDDD